MIKTVSQTTIADVFSISRDKVYKIPKYQREYTWGIKEWDALFNDVTENDFGYFLGSYICVNSGSLKGTILEVIDGQQRFSTITLLLAALYYELSTRKNEMDEDDLSDLANLRNELANKYQKFAPNGSKITEYNQRLFYKNRILTMKIILSFWLIMELLHLRETNQLILEIEELQRLIDTLSSLLMTKLMKLKQKTPTFHMLVHYFRLLENLNRRY